MGLANGAGNGSTVVVIISANGALLLTWQIGQKQWCAVPGVPLEPSLRAMSDDAVWQITAWFSGSTSAAIALIMTNGNMIWTAAASRHAGSNHLIILHRGPCIAMNTIK